MAKISVALSGGGHRASLFGLGTLQYLADSGKHAEVVSIASVSGGSLTNGYVGQNVAYRTTDGETFQAKVTDPFLAQITNHGTLFAPLLSKAYIGLLIVVGLASVVLPWLVTSIHFGWRVLLCLLGITALLGLAWLRGPLCRHALRQTLFSPEGSVTKLTDLHPGVDHVLCATDLQSGDHVYFARDLAYGFQFGLGTPGPTDLATAAGASAALPGAFTPVSIRTRNLGFVGGRQGRNARFLRLVDGGVYDNMADQWGTGYAGRVHRLPPAYADKVPDELITVNSSSGATWTATSLLGVPIIGEVRALLRDKDILYDNTTSHRRYALIERFDAARAAGTGTTGAYIGINQSPYVVARAFEADSTLGPKAKRVLAMLDEGPLTEEQWQEVANRSDGMSTN
ncbi:MAG: patatin-like phospholipase family protein, partial [Actinomycetota bacterium]